MKKSKLSLEKEVGVGSVGLLSQRHQDLDIDSTALKQNDFGDVFKSP